MYLWGEDMSKKNDDFFVKKKVWSEIKDELLRCYLIPYFAKILATKRPVFYVDAFAGKGKFDDGKLGSPLIVLGIIEKAIKSTQYLNPIIEPCFIELKHYKELKKNVEKYPLSKVIEGRYEDNIDKLLDNKRDCNVFMYIDPFGIKPLKFSIFNKLKYKQLNTIEMLMNMNSFGFIREACHALSKNFDIEDLDDVIEDIDYELIRESKNKLADDLDLVAGGQYWRKIIIDYSNNYISGYEAEKRFATEYCNNLKKIFKYVLNIPIRLKKGQRPKYRMIYATNHKDGCILMNDNMCERWQVIERQQSLGQISLFEENVENDIIDQNYLNTFLTNRVKGLKEYVGLREFLASLFMDIGICYKSRDIIKQLKIFEKANKISVKRTPAITDTGKISSFWNESHGHKVEIRCKL